jgi:hypothetical protein
MFRIAKGVCLSVTVSRFDLGFIDIFQIIYLPFVSQVVIGACELHAFV